MFYAGDFQTSIIASVALLLFSFHCRLIDVEIMAGFCADGGSLFTDWSLNIFSYEQLMVEGFGPYSASVETTCKPICVL
jgi:hypothetical protein